MVTVLRNAGTWKRNLFHEWPILNDCGKKPHLQWLDKKYDTSGDGWGGGCREGKLETIVLEQH